MLTCESFRTNPLGESEWVGFSADQEFHLTPSLTHSFPAIGGIKMSQTTLLESSGENPDRGETEVISTEAKVSIPAARVKILGLVLPPNRFAKLQQTDCLSIVSPNRLSASSRAVLLWLAGPESGDSWQWAE